MTHNFYNHTERTRTGFAHVSTFVYNGRVVATATRRYINRTWEAYQYRSSMSCAVSAAIESIEQSNISSYKHEHGYERMTAKRLQAFHEWLEKTSSAYADYKRLYAAL